jgi:malonate transporter MadL subunit
LVIYGVSLLAGCLLVGLFLGDLLGSLIGVQANVGGVGLAMILLILLSDGLRRRGRLTPVTEQGVLFWSAIYIPVVVAMAAKQNVIAAVKGGPAAILAGVGAVALGFLMVPLLSRLGGGRPSERDPTTPTGGGEAGIAPENRGMGSREDDAVESHETVPGEEGMR